MGWLIALIAVLGGGGGIAGIVTAAVAWRNSGTVTEDSRYSQLNELVTQYKQMVDEYRMEAGRDEGRLQALENEQVRLKVEHDQCLNDLTVKDAEIRSLERKVHALEARVAEVGG